MGRGGDLRDVSERLGPLKSLSSLKSLPDI